MPPSRQALNGSNIPTMAATEPTTSLSRHSFSLLPSASLPRDQKKSGPLTLQSPPLPLHPLPPLLFHTLPLSAPHSRTPGPMFAFGLTYMLLLLPSFLSLIWNKPSTTCTLPPTPLSFDPLFYLALSSLPLTYPWPILTIDLKNFLPLMDRHVLTHLVAAQASVNPRFQHPAPVLSSFFKDLAHAVVHTILAPLNSQHMRPNLPPRVFTAEFWHAHFNYAALRTDPALAAI